MTIDQIQRIDNPELRTIRAAAYLEFLLKEK